MKNEKVLIRFVLHVDEKRTKISEFEFVEGDDHPYMHMIAGQIVEFELNGKCGQATVKNGAVWTDPKHPDVQISMLHLYPISDTPALGWWDDNPNA